MCVYVCVIHTVIANKKKEEKIPASTKQDKSMRWQAPAKNVNSFASIQFLTGELNEMKISQNGIFNIIYGTLTFCFLFHFFSGVLLLRQKPKLTVEKRKTIHDEKLSVNFNGVSLSFLLFVRFVLLNRFPNEINSN